MSNTNEVIQIVKSQPVVSNDTAKQAQQPAIPGTANKAPINSSAANASNVDKALMDLEAKRVTWETTVYRTSNQQLYGLLADCLEYAVDLPAAQNKQRAQQLQAFCKQRGYVVKNDSPVVTRVIKAVFGVIDRRRISTYSLVLRAAKTEGIKSSDLASWIEQQGGIQEIKLSRSASYVSPKAKAEAVQKALPTLSDLAVVKNEQLALLADGDFVGEECVFIAEQKADGSFALKALTRSTSAVNAALAALYADQKKSVDAV